MQSIVMHCSLIHKLSHNTNGNKSHDFRKPSILKYQSKLQETEFDGIEILQPTSVEHNPVSGSLSNRILQFRTGSGSDSISKKLNLIRYGYPNCVDHCRKMLKTL